MIAIDNTSPAEKESVEFVETYLNTEFPTSYKKFLLTYNGGSPVQNVFMHDPEHRLYSQIDFLFGLRKDKNLNILAQNSSMISRMPDTMISIGEDIANNRILLVLRGRERGRIYYWDHERETEPADYSNLTLIADSFDEFINNLKSEEEMEELEKQQS